MLANYYKTAVRNISRSRFHALINIVGLSVGISFALLIAAFCWSESRVNHQLRNADRQYFLKSVWKQKSQGLDFTTLGGLARALKENYPSLVANYYRWDGITSAVSYGEKHFREGIQMGDSTLLEMYGFPLLYGDEHTALDLPFSVVITDDKAMKYFGRTDVVGQNLVIDNFSGGKQNFRITGVMQKPTHNSVTFLNASNDNGVFVPASNLPYFGRNMDWANASIPSYVELQKGVKPEAVEKAMAHLMKVNAQPFFQTNLRVVPVALAEYYLDHNGGVARKMIYTLAFIALFILGMAIINFVNLSVSRSGTRMKEIGIRKVLGGLRRQLRVQFLTESILLSVAATIVALFLYAMARPFFAGLLDSALPRLTAAPPGAWAAVILFAFFTGWLAGLYPATMLSALSSIDALKSRTGTVKEKVLLRKGLVGLQFATATVVFAGVIIVSQQINLFFSDELGYNKDYVVSAQLPRDWTPVGVRRMLGIRDVFARMQEVNAVSLSWDIPNGFGGGGLGVYRQGSDSTRAVIATKLLSDQYFAATYRIPMLAGKFFHGPDQQWIPQDSLGMVISESAARALGWQRVEDAVGQSVRLVGVDDVFTVSGVMKDFHFDGMNIAMRPTIVTHVIGLLPFYRYFSFQLRPGKIAPSMESLQKEWARLMPGAPFEYRFMDETLQGLYLSELRLRKAASVATVLCFIIVLLGIVGLVSNSVRRRTKEIAIRKVIGSSATGIVRLFVRDYLPVLLAAGLVASPFAWWLMQRWLDNYATRITITIWPFALAIGCLALIMIVLIAVQTLSAAMANPVKSLKIE